MRLLIALGLIPVATLLVACSSRMDDSEQMLLSARRFSPDFPDEGEVKLTHFGHFGQVRCGDRDLRVAYARGVITGMLAPRGLSWLLFFDDRNRYVDQIPIRVGGGGEPLWCEGSRIYFYGIQWAGETCGNVMDFGGGLSGVRCYSDPREGSLWTEHDYRRAHSMPERPEED